MSEKTCQRERLCVRERDYVYLTCLFGASMCVREIMCVSRLQMVRSNEVCCPLPLVTKNSIYKDKESVHKRERVCVRVRTSTYGFSSTNTSRSEASLCVRVCVVCV